jgi:hypothetical protein
MILDRWNNYPGSRPNGTGTTGLNSNDFNGYIRQQNENTEAQNLQREAAGQGPMEQRFGGGGVESQITSPLGAPLVDPRAEPMGPHGFVGMHGGDEGDDMYAIRDNQFASTNPAMGGLSGLLRKKR